MPSDTALTPKGPLTGIRVIEPGQIAACAFVGSRFTDLDADAVITATMMGCKNTLGYSGQFIYTMHTTRVRRSYTGYYPSLPS